MPDPSPGPKQGSQNDDTVADRQEKLNESVATGEDEDETPDDEDAESFPASDPPANY